MGTSVPGGSRSTHIAVVALVVAATTGALLAMSALPGVADRTRTVAAVLVAAQGLALLRARATPTVVAAVVIALGIGLVLVVPPLGPGLAPAALFAIAVLRPPGISLWALAAAVATAPLLLVGAPASDVLLAVAVAVATWSLGALARSGRLRRADTVRAVAEQERAALAREVHDIVGHSLSMIIVQAGAADDVFDEHPERAREAVRTIDAAARSALAEIRQVIAGSASPHGLGDLDALACGPRDAGLTVDVRVEGTPAAVPATVAASAYRIVQEALTNTVRHSGAHHVDVAVTCGPREVLITVRDDGPPRRRGRPAGRGIAGMRARAQLHGGSCDAAARSGGGFHVRARLPVGTGS